MKNISLTFSARNLATLFKRFHLTFFIIFVAAILAGVVLLVNNVILNPPQASTNPVATQDQQQGAIDTQPDASLEPLRAFHTSDELESAPDLPVGRVSPFLGE